MVIMVGEWSTEPRCDGLLGILFSHTTEEGTHGVELWGVQR